MLKYNLLVQWRVAVHAFGIAVGLVLEQQFDEFGMSIVGRFVLQKKIENKEEKTGEMMN